MMKRLMGLLFLCLFPIFADAQSAPLPVDQAFQLSLKEIQSQQVTLHWQIAPGYHLYRDRFHFLIINPESAALGQINFPAGTSQHDNILGNYQIYRTGLDLQIPFVKVAQKTSILLVSYQGCSESDFCYPPVTKRITIHFDSHHLTKVESHDLVLSTAKPLSIQARIAALLEEKNYFLICFVFIGFGILLAFTPCVLPMIPILSGIIVGQDRKYLTMKRAFFVSLAYVFGMALAYAIAGVAVSLLGSHLAGAFQTPWVVIVFSLLFVLLALSLFDLYELRMPHFIHSRVMHLSNRQRSGSYMGAFMMGALSVLIVSPCVTAPLVGVLTFIAQTGDVLLGSTALFSLGMGMGIPLLIIGTTEGKLLPKSGTWMHVVKAFFGVLLLATAIYLLQHILSGPVILFLWAIFLIILSVYCGLGDHSFLKTGGLKFVKGLGLIAFCYGVILLVGSALGNANPLQPLQGQLPLDSEEKMSTALHFQPVKSLSDFNSALSLAKQQKKVVMLDFYADWCVSCHEMAETTFSTPAVKAILSKFTLLQADVTRNDAVDRALQDKLKVIAPPTVLFFDPEGNELSSFRMVGAVSPQHFLQQIQSMPVS